ncbi:PSMC3 interacting protein [Podochytrium sp. JEL0797]|nr:PSMC3 interacting protein [Podochytrium sp. JEL0797]
MGPKQPPAKKQKTDEDEARDTILKYINTQNRPYNSTDVFQNLHQKIGKTLVTRILEKLAEEKEITGKAFGKTNIYFANQNESDIPSPEEVREMDVKIAALKEDATTLKSENSTLEKQLNALLSSVKTSEISKKLESLNQENGALESRLAPLRNGTKKLTVEDKRAADVQLDAARKHWQTRKKWFNTAWGAFTESMNKKQIKDLMEDIGIETDESVDMDLAKDPLEGLM